ncbi:MAG: tRNA (guanosine(37)-N1)-methyltransferase TrmD [Spirochaetales bacterium]|nr:tRNA (guanosine(37)-N1)-methyltransferase TrmD [Spirochaetales bacterium]
MKMQIVTLFPEMVEGFFKNSIMKRAVEKNVVEYEIIDFRRYATDKHQSCDDVPYGGGAGMVIKCDPLAKALEALKASGKRVVYASPSGRRFTQQYAENLSKEQELVFICGHYEGIDQRLIDLYVDDEISIGDYVISSGEVSTLVIIDAVYRLLDGVISSESLQEESLHGNLLEYPQYTRPETYCSKDVPDVLLSGHHAKIGQWRLQKRLEKTLSHRPDLLETASLDANSRKILNTLKEHSAKGTVDDGCY